MALALASMAFAIVSCVLILGAYRERLARQLDPCGTNAFPQAPGKAGIGKPVLFLGDSRAAHWPPASTIRRDHVSNRGISGQTTAQILGRFDAHVRPLRPEVVILQAGSNDLKCIPLFPDRADEIEKNCLENLRQIVARCVDSGATVILTTIFPHGRIPLYRRPFFDSRVTEATKRVNEQLKRLAGPRVIVMDTWPILAGPDGLVRPEFERDLLHLTPEGYGALNARLEAMVADALGTPNHGPRDN